MIDEPKLIKSKPIYDSRGYFEEKVVFNDNMFELAQINHSFNHRAKTLRGCHYQEEPFSQIKVVTCLKGSILDFCIDIRKDSPTFMECKQFKLSELNGYSLVVPKGWAHGYYTYTDDCLVQYVTNNHYAPNYAKGLNYLSPRIIYKDTLPLSELVVNCISEQDRNLPYDLT